MTLSGVDVVISWGGRQNTDLVHSPFAHLPSHILFALPAIISWGGRQNTDLVHSPFAHLPSHILFALPAMFCMIFVVNFLWEMQCPTRN